MTESFTIPYHNRKQWAHDYGLNKYWAGTHWSKRKQDAEYWHNLVRAEMNAQKVRRYPFENPVIITMYFNDRLDSINHAAVFKMVEDALKGRVINDDSRRCVRGSEIYFHEENYIRVVIREV